MAIVTIFSSAFSQADDISEQVAQRTGWEKIDGTLLKNVSKRFGVEEQRLIRAMEGPSFLFNKFTHQREKYLAQIKLVLAEMLQDGQVLHGFASQMVPRDISHVLRVCIVSDPEYRASQLKKDGNSHPTRTVQEEDLKRAQWTQKLFGAQPWDQTLYDLKIPVNETGMDKAVDLIVENASKEMMSPSEASRKALEDFLVAAKGEMALVEAGHYHTVSCQNGILTVMVDEYVMRLEKLESEFKKILSNVEGAKDVTVKTGPNYRPTSVFANVEFELPEKVLLVDDEKDFVLTLSERLQMRDLDPAIAYSGEEALNLLKEEEEPEVMVLDLKMPGIDGIEVLRRVKAEHPEVEVIVLTGHGSEKDKELCMDLGAFGYLEKPVDIAVLSDTMKRAKEALKAKREGKE